MPFLYDVKTSQFEAEKESQIYDKNNFKELLNKYGTELKNILNSYKGEEGSIPIDHKYFFLRNKYQYVLAKFTKE